MTATRRTTPALLAAALVTIYLVWGTTYLGIRVAVETIPPFLLSGVRYSLAGVLLLGWVAIRGGLREGWPTRRHWWSAALTGVGLVALGNGGVSWGEQYVSSGVAAIVIATMPIWMALLARIFYRDQITVAGAFGLGLGFTGLVILIGPATIRPAELIGLLAVLLAAVGWAAGSVYVKNASLPDNPFQVAGMQMLCGGGVMLVTSLLTGDFARFRPSAVSFRSEVAFVYLLFIGAIVAFGVYLWLIKNAPLGVVGTYAYVNPVVAVTLGHFLLGEQVTVRSLIGGAVTIVGVAVIVTAQAQAQAGPNARPADARSGSSATAQVGGPPINDAADALSSVRVEGSGN